MHDTNNQGPAHIPDDYVGNPHSLTIEYHAPCEERKKEEGKGGLYSGGPRLQPERLTLIHFQGTRTESVFGHMRSLLNILRYAVSHTCKING